MSETAFVFRNKLLPEDSFSSKGLTDKFFRFSDKKRFGSLVVRSLHVPGGNVYQGRLTPETIAIRERELARYKDSSAEFNITVVPHFDVEAREKPHSQPKLWTLADRVPGPTIYDLLGSGDRTAFDYQKRVLQAGVAYCVAAIDDEKSGIVATDLMKPSQFVVGDSGQLIMIDTNPPLWKKTKGVDNILSEAFMLGMGALCFVDDADFAGIVADIAPAVQDIIPIPKTSAAITNTFAALGLPEGHPQRILMQNASLNLLLERPVV